MVFEDPIKTTVEELQKLLAIENVIGETIETEDKLLIPVMKMGMGFGAGMGEGSGPAGQGGGKGSGAGAAAGLEPIAVIAVFKGVSGSDGVKVFPLTGPDPISRAIGEIGSVATEMVKQYRKSGEESKEGDKEVK
ncbi:MAG: sporulation protein [Euryarchaeota archaeon]|nr:sporulation protein [Euryarchaeota archaeon]